MENNKTSKSIKTETKPKTAKKTAKKTTKKDVNDELYEKLMDENNLDPIVLFDEEDNKYNFEQIAIVPIKSELYVILKPIDKIKDIADDEAIVFKITKSKNSETLLIVEDDEKINTEVFDVYYKLLDESEKK